MNRTCRGITVGLGVAVLALALQAEAVEIRIKCEKRLNPDGSAERSKISVDGKDLDAGTYTAMVASGDNGAISNSQSAMGDEVEFDFDSNNNDVDAGAKEIDPDFIQSTRDGMPVIATVHGKVVNNANDETVATAWDVFCRVKD